MINLTLRFSGFLVGALFGIILISISEGIERKEKEKQFIEELTPRYLEGDTVNQYIKD